MDKASLLLSQTSRLKAITETFQSSTEKQGTGQREMGGMDEGWGVSEVTGRAHGECTLSPPPTLL